MTSMGEFRRARWIVDGMRKLFDSKYAIKKRPLWTWPCVAALYVRVLVKPGARVTASSNPDARINDVSFIPVRVGAV